MVHQGAGGHIATVFILPNPKIELAQALKAIADSEAEAGVNLQVILTGTLSLRSVLQTPLDTADYKPLT